MDTDQKITDHEEIPDHNIDQNQIEENKDQKQEIKKCDPCMHCGFHCIFLKEDE